MKKILFVLALSLVSLCASAQTKIAYCDVYARGGGKHMKITIMYNNTPYEMHPDGNRSNLGNVLNELAADGWVLDRDVIIPRFHLWSLCTRHKVHLIMKKEYQEGENPFTMFEEVTSHSLQLPNEKHTYKQNDVLLIEQPAKAEDKLLVSKRENDGTWHDAQLYCDELGEGWMLPNKEQIDYICDNFDIKFNNCWTNTEINEKKAKAYYRGYSFPFTTIPKSTNNVGIVAIKVVNNAD